METAENKILLVPAAEVESEFGIVNKTLRRWEDDPRLNFPRSIKIQTRLYYDRAALEAWKLAQIRKSAGGK